MANAIADEQAAMIADTDTDTDAEADAAADTAAKAGARNVPGLCFIPFRRRYLLRVLDDPPGKLEHLGSASPDDNRWRLLPTRNRAA